MLTINDFTLLKTTDIGEVTISIYKSNISGNYHYYDGFRMVKSYLSKTHHVCIYHRKDQPVISIPTYSIQTFTRASKRFDKIIEILQSNKTQILLNGTF